MLANCCLGPDLISPKETHKVPESKHQESFLLHWLPQAVMMEWFTGQGTEGDLQPTANQGTEALQCNKPLGTECCQQPHPFQSKLQMHDPSPG